MPRPSPLLSTTTEVMMVCRANAPKLFAPNTRAYLSIVRSAAIWYLKEKDCLLKCTISCSACNNKHVSLLIRHLLHGYCYQQHVQALEYDVSGVADPDVSDEGHEEECCCSEARETPESQLPPLIPPHLREADTVRCGCSCKTHPSGFIVEMTI